MMFAILNDDNTIKQVCIGYQPENGVAVTDDIANHPNDYVYQNGQFVYSPTYLQRIKQDKINELDAKCDAAIIAGFTSSALGTAHTYPSDKEAQDYLKDCIKRLELDSTKTTVGFKTLDTGYLDHTLAQLHQVFIDGFDYGDNQIIKLNNLKAQVTAATTVSAVNAIVWS